eukprot:4666232-Prymnesium_polylepis.1
MASCADRASPADRRRRASRPRAVRPSRVRPVLPIRAAARHSRDRRMATSHEGHAADRSRHGRGR